MIKYKIRKNAIDINSKHPIEDYLRSLGVDKVDSFLNMPQEEDRLNPFLLDNIDKCIDELHYAFTNNMKFFLIVDSDVDGYTSASIFYRFFKKLYPAAFIEWYLHEGKEHGIIVNDVPRNCDYVIVPDAGSVQVEEQEELVNMGKKIIIIDHHIVDEYYQNDNVILVNNQCSNSFPNKSLSGAGMVLKVIEAYNEKYNCGVNTKDYYDIAALGILSDCMDVRNLDNNYIIFYGLNNLKNELFKAIINKQSRGFADLEHPTKIEVVFYVSPIINGVVREGTQEEKTILFKGFIEEPTNDTITTQYRGENREETFYEYAARLSMNIKNRQDRKKVKSFDFLRERIEKNGLDKNSVIVVTTSINDEVPTPSTLTGLIAMELSKYFGKPCLVLRPKKENGINMLAGSGRGDAAEGFESFLQVVKDSKYSVYGEGHNFAFGACIYSEHLNDFIQETNEKLKDVDFNTSISEVECVFSNIYNNPQIIFDFATNSFIYGTGIPSPKIALTTTISGSSIKIMGADKSSLKFLLGSIECIRFKDKELTDRIEPQKQYHITAIGTPKLNEFNGQIKPQILLDMIELEEITRQETKNAARKLF